MASDRQGVRTPETHLQRRLRNRSRWEKAESARIGQSAERHKDNITLDALRTGVKSYKWEMRDGAHQTLRLQTGIPYGIHRLKSSQSEKFWPDYIRQKA